MASPDASPTPKTPRQCPSCKKSEPEVSFYNLASDCRTCIRLRAGGFEKPAVREPLELKVERHRQEKLLREELKKIARQRFKVRETNRKRRVKRAKAQAAIPKRDSEREVDAATKELAQRMLERRRLIEFVQAFHPKYKAGWVHHDICARLEKFSREVEEGKSPRLMILMPPRHGKSQIASKLFPAWHMGHHPHHEVMACSYNVSLAIEFSREVRAVLRSDRYAKLFENTKLDPESQSAEAWKLLSPTGVGGGGYFAAGVGGSITGKGAHVLVIDDPIKNAEEASSPEHLQKIWDWYNSAAYTRLAPGGGVLLIQTWWSDLDLAGRLQEAAKEDPDADQFEIVKYPAIAVEEEEFRMPGDPLHPERYSLEQLLKIKAQLGGDKGRFWNALYQQNPIPDEGAFFTSDMIVHRAAPPELPVCYIYQAWDFAIGEKRHNDWTVGVTVAVDYNDTAHIIDVQRLRTADMLKIADLLIDTWLAYPNVQVVGVEDGQIWRGIESHLKKRLAERQVYPVIQTLKPLTDKTVRARPLQGRMQQRKVTLPNQAPWIPELKKELLRFPGGMHDDIVDALSWCITLLLGRSPPKRERVLTNKPSGDLKSRLKQLGVTFGARGGHMAA
jgi:predicted phage terminase large subunit-like protein